MIEIDRWACALSIFLRTNFTLSPHSLKSIQQREEEERYKRSKRQEDRKVINEQIEARRRARLLELEAREQENQGTVLLLLYVSIV